jgi:hypothetical protein
VLSAEEERRLRADEAAASWFDAQAPWYRRTALHWVTSAKRPETRARRLEELIRDSAAGRTIKMLTRSGGAEAATPKAPRVARAPKAATPKPSKPSKAAKAPKAATAKAPIPKVPRRKSAPGEAAPKAPRERPAPRAGETLEVAGDSPSPAAKGARRPRARRTALGNRVERRPPG